MNDKIIQYTLRLDFHLNLFLRKIVFNFSHIDHETFYAVNLITGSQFNVFIDNIAVICQNVSFVRTFT